MNLSERRWEQMMSFLAESVLETPDEDILAETLAAGQEPEAVAEGVRHFLKESAKAHQQRLLNDAMQEYLRQSARLKEKKYALPETPEERRDLLDSLFNRFPQMQSAFVTIQHREFTSLSDSDIESFLKQLQELGVLEAPAGSAGTPDRVAPAGTAARVVDGEESGEK